MSQKARTIWMLLIIGVLLMPIGYWCFSRFSRTAPPVPTSTFFSHGWRSVAQIHGDFFDEKEAVGVLQELQSKLDESCRKRGAPIGRTYVEHRHSCRWVLYFEPLPPSGICRDVWLDREMEEWWIVLDSFKREGVTWAYLASG